MPLLIIIFSLLFVSCSGNKMDINKGTFQTMKPPNIYGNGQYLEKETIRTLSYEANMGKNKTIPFSENMNYRLIENSLGLQFLYTEKYKPFYVGFGGGMQNFPYGLLTLGCNGKLMEIGGAAFWGLALNKASYEGIATNYSKGVYDEYIRLEDVKILHSYGGAGAYASLFWKKFALNYAGSVSSPWFVDALPASIEYDAAVAGFPLLIMQDFGISYKPNKVKYRLGINQITGIKFPGQYWGLSVQMARDI